MNYFIISESINPDVIGDDYPQTYKFIKGYNPESENGIFSIYDYRTSFPDYIPDLDGIKLSGSAKLTDFVSHGFKSCSFIVSEKAKSILEKYKLCMHRFYPLGLYKRNKKYDYFLFWIISDYSDFVDYEKSTFMEYNISSDKKFGAVSVRSKEELLQKKEIVKEKTDDLLQTIWGDNIVMNRSFGSELDFFEITIIDGSTYISERLKNDIEYNGLTGWDFNPATKLVIP
jgi:hypothetical protein